MNLNSKSCQIQDELFPGVYDESNALILPGSRPKVSQAERQTPKGIKTKKRPLTKKQRKKLEKIVKRRNDKKNRSELLSELQQYTLSEQVYKSLSPMVLAQQRHKNELRSEKKLKRFQNNNHKLLDTHEMEVNERSVRHTPLISVDVCVGTQHHRSTLVRTNCCIQIPQGEEGGESQTYKQVVVSAKSSIPVDQFLVMSKSSVHTEKGQSTQQDAIIGIKESIEPTRVIPNRTSSIVLSRSKLPIIGEEQIIMEAIRENLVVVLAGETGSGKTTQVPQFLFEAGYASNGKIIGVTEPRRIAAIAMSQRVSHELNVPKDTVSYQIRFEGNTSTNTKIKFMTDGVLLKEMENDFLLTRYSVVCIDEAHERSLYTDILIGLLSRTIRVRHKKGNPLRVVIMSATMRVEDFTSNHILFPKPPAFIHIPARQYPVHIHFNKVTPDNFLDAAKKKVARIHNTLPEGGILVFVTGQEEVKKLVKILNKMFSSVEKSQGHAKIKRHNVRELSSQITEFDLTTMPTFPVEDSVNKNESDSEEENVETDDVRCGEPLIAIPLYSMLSTKEQEKVFAPPAKNTRLCVVATNVAETSLTIPGIRYVVDCGKVKQKLWDKLTGIQKYEVTWCSKASSQQRAGRAGRTGPGHCYRLELRLSITTTAPWNITSTKKGAE